MRKTSLIALPIYLGLASFVSGEGSHALAQPQPKVELTNKGIAKEKIAFPAQFSLPEFFDLVSRSAATRIIAPGNDNNALTKKLNASLAND